MINVGINFKSQFIANKLFRVIGEHFIPEFGTGQKK
jgi:hypothetical protein